MPSLNLLQCEHVEQPTVAQEQQLIRKVAELQLPDPKFSACKCRGTMELQ